MLLRLIRLDQLVESVFQYLASEGIGCVNHFGTNRVDAPENFSALRTSHCCFRRDIGVNGNAMVAGGASEVIPLFFPASRSEPTPS